ncbi:MAG: lipoprotein insertase outer membrane protein LolB [Congregibacter sp.]
MPRTNGLAARTRLAALALAIAISAACTTQTTAPGGAPSSNVPDEPPPSEVPDEETRWAQRVSLLSNWSEWRVRGKVAYRIPEDAGSANLHWSQLEDASTLRLSGPLGAASTRITNEGALLRVRRDGIERLYPADAAPWLPGKRLLPVPIQSVHYWLRGVPDPDIPIDQLEHDDALAIAITQAGWQIKYLEYRIYKGTSMPLRLQLTAPDSELMLTVVLRAWELDKITDG